MQAAFATLCIPSMPPAPPASPQPVRHQPSPAPPACPAPPAPAPPVPDFEARLVALGQHWLRPVTPAGSDWSRQMADGARRLVSGRVTPWMFRDHGAPSDQGTWLWREFRDRAGSWCRTSAGVGPQLVSDLAGGWPGGVSSMPAALLDALHRGHAVRLGTGRCRGVSRAPRRQAGERRSPGHGPWRQCRDRAGS